MPKEPEWGFKSASHVVSAAVTQTNTAHSRSRGPRAGGAAQAKRAREGSRCQARDRCASKPCRAPRPHLAGRSSRAALFAERPSAARNRRTVTIDRGKNASRPLPTLGRDQRLNPHLDLVADGAHAIDGLLFRVQDRPIIAAGARNDGALVTAPHRHQRVDPLREIGSQSLRTRSGEIESNLL